MNVTADMAVWCHVRAATVGVRWVLLMLLTVAGVLSVMGGWTSVTTGASSALYLVEYCSTGYGGSCSSLVAAYMSAAFTCAAFLSLKTRF